MVKQLSDLESIKLDVIYNGGSTPLDFARLKGHIDVVNILENRRNSRSSEINRAVGNRARYWLVNSLCQALGITFPT